MHPPSVESLFAPVLGFSAFKPCWPPKQTALSPPPPDARPLGWGAWHEAQSCQSCWITSVIQLFSGLWVTHPGGVGFDYIVCVPLVLSCAFFLVSLNVASFLGRSKFILLMVVQQLAVIWV